MHEFVQLMSVNSLKYAVAGATATLAAYAAFTIRQRQIEREEAYKALEKPGPAESDDEQIGGKIKSKFKKALAKQDTIPKIVGDDGQEVDDPALKYDGPIVSREDDDSTQESQDEPEEEEKRSESQENAEHAISASSLVDHKTAAKVGASSSKVHDNCPDEHFAFHHLPCSHEDNAKLGSGGASSSSLGHGHCDPLGCAADHFHSAGAILSSCGCVPPTPSSSRDITTCSIDQDVAEGSSCTQGGASKHAPCPDEHYGFKHMNMDCMDMDMDITLD